MPRHSLLTGAQLHEPGLHAASHATGQPDEITPGDIGAGTGTVTSVAQTVPAEFAIAGSPVTTTGTLAITKATQAANTVWAGPTSGGVVAPAFRALVAADLPTRGPAYATRTGAGVWYAGWGDGNPGTLFHMIHTTNITTASADTVSTTSFNRARCVRFRLPRALDLTDVQLLGPASGSAGSLWKLAIYPEAGGAYTWASAAFDTTANDWAGPSGITGVTLAADTDYLLCLLATASSASTSMRTLAAPISVNYHKFGGPLDSAGQGFPIYKEFIVATPGTFDATLPTLVALSTTTGMPPVAMLTGTST